MSQTEKIKHLRQRQLLINKVRNYWIKGVLEKSLYNQVLIELDLEERLDRIASPIGISWNNTEESRQRLPSQTKIIDFFQDMGLGRSLLILGEPGSGKTTALIEIARHLIIQAENDINLPIPVIFNLTSWGNEGESIADWLESELNTQYQINNKISESWLEEQQLLLLLDGLDELTQEKRHLCVRALNNFRKNYGDTEIIICSRDKDYETIPEKLTLQSSVYLQPLSLEQIQNYLTSLGSQVEVVSNLLEQDKKLQDLLSSPLMLNIAILAYQGMKFEDLSNEDSKEARRKHLFNTYIEKMFSRRNSNSNYSKHQTIHWLSELAIRIHQQAQTVFLIEKMQPTWLKINGSNGFFFSSNQWIKSNNSQAYKLYSRSVKFICACVWILIYIIYNLVENTTLENTIAILIFIVLGTLRSQVEPIESVSKLKWSWKNSFTVIPGIFLIVFYLSAEIFPIYLIGLSLIIIFLGGLQNSRLKTTLPNQGILNSAKNAGLITLISVIFLFSGLIVSQGILPISISFGQILSTVGISGLVLAMIKGGTACIQHFVLRAIVTHYDYAPWNYADFLNYTTRINLLQKIGGGYIFIHRLLQEHFIHLEIEKQLNSFQVNPEQSETYLQRGNLYLSIARYQEAIVDYDRALELNSSLAEAYFGKSWAHYYLGEDEGVLENYDRAYLIDSKVVEGVFYTAPRELDSDRIENSETYVVTLLNDNINTFNHVYYSLLRYIPNMNQDYAWKLTNQVHNEGQAVVWFGSKSLAQLYRSQLSNAGLTMDICWLKVDQSDNEL